MKQIIKSLNYRKDFKSFLNYLRTDKKFYAKTPRELLMIARDISKRLDEKLLIYNAKPNTNSTVSCIRSRNSI